MSRALLIVAVWAVLIALTVLLAHIAGPEPRRQLGLASELIPAGQVELEVAYPAPIEPHSEARITYSPPSPVPAAPAQAAAKPTPLTPTPPPPAKPKRTFPQREGATESGIAGLGSLPAGPGAAYQGLGVQVFARPTGQPVTGARVRFALQAQLDEWQRAHPETPLERADPETILEICTQPVHTKSHGVALTDSAPGRMLVDARVGTQYGFAWVDRDKDARARIDLVEDHALTVRVTDANGVQRPNTALLVRDSSCAELWRGITDANGTARWKHAAFLIERDASPGACVVMLESVDASPQVGLIRRPFSGVDDLDFRIDARGKFQVNVVDAAGAPVMSPLVVTCSTNKAIECRSAVRRTLENGVATFDLVQTGLELNLEIDGQGVFENATATMSGPRAEA